MTLEAVVVELVVETVDVDMVILLRPLWALLRLGGGWELSVLLDVKCAQVSARWPVYC